MAFSATNDGNGAGPMAEINIIPLCDVMLVLLIIFMIASPALSHRIPLDLPQPSPVIEQTTPPTPIDLRIDAAGQLSWNGDALPWSVLPAMLATEGRRPVAEQPLLQIDANGDSDYQVIATVLAEARNADMQKIGLVSR